MPLLPGGLVEEEEEGSPWREEKNKVGQGGILETYIQPGDKMLMEEERDGTGGVDSPEEKIRIGPSFYFDKEDELGGEITKRAWNSYFTGGFGKRSEDTTWRKGKARESVLVSKPLRSSLGAFPRYKGKI